MNATLNALHILMYATLLVALVSLAVVARLIPRRRAHVVGALSWCIHVAIFYTALIFWNLQPLTANIWSTVIRIQTGLIFASIGISLLAERYTLKKMGKTP